RPATIQTVVKIDLPRPRDLDSPGYLECRDRIFAAMGMSLRIGDNSNERKSRPAPPAAPPEQEEPEPAGARKNRPGLDAEVIIIGGGPAGSTLGAYLAGAGIDHVILDQALHPRPHVGESLVCSTTRIFEEIEFLPVMEREAFVHKHGALWTHWADD